MRYLFIMFFTVFTLSILSTREAAAEVQQLSCQGNINIKECLSKIINQFNGLLLEKNNEIATLKQEISALKTKIDPLDAVAKLKSFKLDGDKNTFYPVWFADNCWFDGETRLNISRSSIHTDERSAGSLNARFVSHSSAWGHGSQFLEASLEQSNGDRGPFIGNFEMPFYPAGMVVWLRGGGLTYYYKSSCVNTNAFFDLNKKFCFYDNDPLHPEYAVCFDKITTVSASATNSIGQGWKRY
ncbi:MAG: hypothetical protein HQK51_13495 [Oligoflexia bacterium]|nr:hypothetical protein [Oligoflexia bacterium]